MTAAEKLVERLRKVLLENVKNELLKKYPEASEADIDEMIARYEEYNPPPV